MNNAAKPRILLVEDDLTVQNLVSTALDLHGYVVSKVCNGQAAIMDAVSHGPSLIMLDLGLPDIDGIEVITKIRSWSAVPIIVISARTEDSDKIAALDAGADDYLTKPFASQELLARIRAMTREQTAQTTSQLHVGNVTLDRATFELSTPSGSLRLANKEFQMLELLMCNPRNLISTERFLEKIWGYDNEAEINVVWVYISYLRKKLAALHSNVQIKARRNVGYSLEEIS